VPTFETSVFTHPTTRSYIPEDGTLHSHCCENLKSYVIMRSLSCYRFHMILQKPATKYPRLLWSGSQYVLLPETARINFVGNSILRNLLDDYSVSMPYKRNMALPPLLLQCLKLRRKENRLESSSVRTGRLKRRMRS
jgi:hypothetical protein